MMGVIDEREASCLPFQPRTVGDLVTHAWPGSISL